MQHPLLGSANFKLSTVQEFDESLHSLLLWLARAEKKRDAVDIRDPETPLHTLKRQHRSLTVSSVCVQLTLSGSSHLGRLPRVIEMMLISYWTL